MSAAAAASHVDKLAHGAMVLRMLQARDSDVVRTFMPWLTVLGRPEVQADSMACASKRGAASTPLAPNSCAARGARLDLLMH